MPTTKNNNLSVDVFDLTGKVVSSMTLPPEIFDVKVSPSLVTQAIRVYQANKRMGTHGSKTRGMVIGTTKKMFKQKGTGRARHGSAKAPIFVGGGSAHGPHPRDYSLDLPKSMKKLALLGVLSQRAKENQIKIVDGIKNLNGKTKELFDSLIGLNVFPKNEKRKKALLLLSENLPTVYQAGKNIESLTIKDTHLINALDILLFRNIVLMKEGVQTLVDVFGDKEKGRKSKISEGNPEKIKSEKEKKEVKKKVNPPSPTRLPARQGLRRAK